MVVFLSFAFEYWRRSRFFFFSPLSLHSPLDRFMRSSICGKDDLHNRQGILKATLPLKIYAYFLYFIQSTGTTTLYNSADTYLMNSTILKTFWLWNNFVLWCLKYTFRVLMEFCHQPSWSSGYDRWLRTSTRKLAYCPTPNLCCSLWSLRERFSSGFHQSNQANVWMVPRIRFWSVYSSFLFYDS